MKLDVAVTTLGVVQDVEHRLDDPRPALEQVADDIRDRQQRVFATAAGGTWDPLNPSTAARKGSDRVLVDSGALMRSLTTRGGRDSIARVDRDELLVGTRHPTAVLHRSGARGMPKRNPVPPPTAVEADRWAGLLGGYIVDG